MKIMFKHWVLAWFGLDYLSFLQCQHCNSIFLTVRYAKPSSSTFSEMKETWVWSLGWEDHPEKGKATHSSILAWRIPSVHGVTKSWSRLSDFHFTSRGAFWTRVSASQGLLSGQVGGGVAHHQAGVTGFQTDTGHVGWWGTKEQFPI